MDHQQIAYRFKSTPKSKISNEMTQYDLFEVEYSNFLKCWESTTTSEKHTTLRSEKMVDHSIKILPDDADQIRLFH